MNQLPVKISRKIKRLTKTVFARARARLHGIIFAEPNYMFKGPFSSKSVIIDTGCGFDADFSIAMIKRYNVTAYGIDPTHKHQDALAALAQNSGGHFIPVPLAVSATNGTITFHESKENVSGSLLADHRNITRDTVESYAVESVTLGELMGRLGLTRADYLKLDLEGAEYELLDKSDPAVFDSFDQILIEFHHDTVASYTSEDTARTIQMLSRRGFKNISFDGHTYLFFK